MRVIFVSLLSFIAYSIAHTQDRDISYVTSGGKLKPLQSIMDIRHYTLSLEVDTTKKSIAGFAEIDFILDKPSDSLLFDLLHFYKVTRVLIDKKQQVVNHMHDSL
ncbi:MAG: hypothetical protein EOO05_20090, partial [Chitinophagaceae bacterium]